MELERVNIHGCHSVEFCCHAYDTLEDILGAYRDQAYSWVGVTEHMPADQMNYMLPEEREQGFTLESLVERFRKYADTVAGLKSQFAGQLEVIFGFETEVYPGYAKHLERLLKEFQPEYIVGSVHFVHGVGIDASPEHLALAAVRAGGYVELYCDYFDEQLALIERFDPKVIGHFDLIRLFDAQYADRLKDERVWSRVERNLAAVRDRGAILDMNIAAIRKGLPEPYPHGIIASRAIEMGIPLVPGEDAHSVEQVGMNRERGVDWLLGLGGSSEWVRPV